MHVRDRPRTPRRTHCVGNVCRQSATGNAKERRRRTRHKQLTAAGKVDSGASALSRLLLISATCPGEIGSPKRGRTEALVSMLFLGQYSGLFSGFSHMAEAIVCVVREIGICATRAASLSVLRDTQRAFKRPIAEGEPYPKSESVHLTWSGRWRAAIGPCGKAPPPTSRHNPASSTRSKALPRAHGLTLSRIGFHNHRHRETPKWNANDAA
jgi:hypothetical protein